MSQTYQISTNAMIGHVTSLRLNRGDCLLVTHPEALKYLQNFKNPYIDFMVPIIFVPGKDMVSKLTRQDLLNLLEQTDQIQAQETEFTGNAPL